MKMQSVKCYGCEKIFSTESKTLKYRIKLDPSAKSFCSRDCYFNWKRSFKVTKNCSTCNKEIIVFAKDVMANNFCNRSCAATFNNKVRESLKGKKKIYPCETCGVISEVGRNAKWVCKNKVCEKYVATGNARRRLLPAPQKSCKRCASSFRSKNAVFCQACIGTVRKEAAIKSVEKQGRRSKNEIYFSQLCEKKYSNVSSNKPMFEKWDADVILEDEKIAVLWNGNWHYQPIYKERSLLQIQTRDKLKVAAIKRCGYTPYVVKDRGKYKKKFVEEQFALFEKYVADKSNGLILDPLEEVEAGHLDI